jgi:drug/metabolite transporter (DMT)-like permease
VLAPFVYTQIIWMIIAGFVVFGDLPDVWTLVGAAIVIAAGLVVFARERVLGRETTVPAPGD